MNFEESNLEGFTQTTFEINNREDTQHEEQYDTKYETQFEEDTQTNANLKNYINDAENSKGGFTQTTFELNNREPDEVYLSVI